MDGSRRALVDARSCSGVWQEEPLDTPATDFETTDLR
jgi:hypothetical protein